MKLNSHEKQFLYNIGQQTKKLIDVDMQNSMNFSFEITPNIVQLQTSNVLTKNLGTGEIFEAPIILLGFYSVEKCVFHWYDIIVQIRCFIIEQLNKLNYTKLIEVIDGLLQKKKLYVENCGKDFLPILCALFNPAFTLVKFQDEHSQVIMYALIKLGVKSTITDQLFFDLLFDINLTLTSVDFSIAACA